MKKRFVFAHEPEPGADWLARFNAGRAETERWYRGDGLAEPPSAAACRAVLARHMPELLSPYDKACALVRSYDFPLKTVSDRFESTAWFGREVIAKAQRPWGGCLDSMNADGLVASLTFGGGRDQGEGFSIILILRYVLETCHRVDEAAAALCRIPVALTQNVTLLDAVGGYATVYLGPNRAPAVTKDRLCTNHQEQVTWPEHAAQSRTVERHAHLAALLNDSAMTLDDLAGRFLEPPLHSRRAAFPTVYTAVYRPAERRVDYLWPGRIISQTSGGFAPGDYTHDYDELKRD